jgi:hypothetical protein
VSVVDISMEVSLVVDEIFVSNSLINNSPVVSNLECAVVFLPKDNIVMPFVCVFNLPSMLNENVV